MQWLHQKVELLLEHAGLPLVVAAAQPFEDHRLVVKRAFKGISVLFACPGYYDVYSAPQSAAWAVQGTEHVAVKDEHWHIRRCRYEP